MASDGGPMFPIKGTLHWGASVRDGFAIAITSQGDRDIADRSATLIYDWAQVLTDEKLRRDEADQDERKAD